MAIDNTKEISREYLRRTAMLEVSEKPILHNYHEARTIAEILARFSVPLANGCWAWKGGHYRASGRPRISYRKKGRRYHRNAATLVYENQNGPLPEGKEVSHVCPPGGLFERCVNPDHLIAETHSENLKRRRPWRAKRGTNCRHCGKPKVPARNGNRKPELVCISCRSTRAKDWRERTGYSFNDYREANRDTINANRRASRARARREGRRVT